MEASCRPIIVTATANVSFNAAVKEADCKSDEPEMRELR